MLLRRNEHSAELLVREELDGGVGEDAEEGCRMAPEEATDAGLSIDVAHGGHDAEPGAGVFGELGVGGLKEDFDAVEGADDGFGLVARTVSVWNEFSRDESWSIPHIQPTLLRGLYGGHSLDFAYFADGSPPV